jgi:hypothetical protein
LKARDVDRVEALPFAVRKPTGDFLAEARRLYGQVMLSSHLSVQLQLVELDRRHLIASRGKTNRQYLRERTKPACGSILKRRSSASKTRSSAKH